MKETQNQTRPCALAPAANRHSSFVIRHFKFFLLALTLAFSLLPSALLIAAPRTCTWTGDSSGYWGNSVNWNITGGGLNTPQDGDDLVFPAGAGWPLNTNNLSDRHFNSILIQAAGYTLRDRGDNPITLTNGLRATYANGVSTVGLGITLGAAQTFECVADMATLLVSNDIALGSHTLTVDGGGMVRLQGVLSGAGGLTKNGAGLLRLEGDDANTFQGVTRVNTGRLALEKSDPPAIPTGALIIGDGAGGAEADQVVEYADYQIGTLPITINSSGLLDLEAHDDDVGALEFNGGLVSTIGGVTAGILTLNGSVTVHDTAGATIEGHISILNIRVFAISNSAYSPDLALRAVISGPGGIVKTGAGALGLYGNNVNWGGPMTVQEGLVYLYHDGALGWTTPTAGTVVTNTGVLVLPGGRAIAAEPLTLSGGGGSSGALASSSGDNTWAGPITLATDADITVRTNSTLTLSGIISGPGGFTKAQRSPTFAQTGTLTLSGASGNAFLGDAYVQAGTLELGKTSGDAVPNTLHVGTIGGASQSVVARNVEPNQIGSVVVNHSGLYDLNGHNESVWSLTLTDGGDVQTGTGTLFLGPGSAVTVNAPNWFGTVATVSGKLDLGSRSHTFNVAPDLQIDAVVSGSAEIVKEGAGTMELAAANTFIGPVTIHAGAVRVTDALGLGTAEGSTTVASGAALSLDIVDPGPFGGLAEPLTLAGAGQAGAGAMQVLRPLSWWTDIGLAGDTTISVSSGSTLETLYRITGSGNLTKIGPGILRMSGVAANTYAGDTYVNQGRLELAKTAANVNAVPGDLFIGDGIGGEEADIVVVDLTAWPVHQIADTAAVTIADSGSLQVVGFADRFEQIGLLTGTGVVRLEAGKLSVANNLDCTYAGTIHGTGNFAKSGTGTLTLTGDNTYTGVTFVGTGTLIVNGSQPDSQVDLTGHGTLGGNGSVGHITLFRILDNPGIVAPGNTTGNVAGHLKCKGLSSQLGFLKFDLTAPVARTGYDQLDVDGRVRFSEGYLQLNVGYAPAEGDQFTIINNDLEDAVEGTFYELPEGTVFPADPSNPVKFHITYRGGTDTDHNDVVLTVTNTALLRERVAVRMGNGNGVLDPNECNTLEVVLRNRDAATVAGIDAVLSTTTPGVWITQGESPYPNLPPGATGTNARPFQISTAPDFPCGTTVQLALQVRTAAHGSFTIPLSLTSGCDDGGGPCLPCPNQVVRGTLAMGDPQTQRALRPEGGAGACDTLKPCPGFNVLPDPYRYHQYAFQNGASTACVQVVLVTADSGVYSAIYTNQFVPDNPCAKYRADAGRRGAASYAFPVAARERFIVVVVGQTGDSYELQVSGGSCQPWLEIARAEEEKVVLSWPSFASDFHLDATNVVEQLTHCVPVPEPPVVVGGACVVTNRCTPARRFYQLHRRTMSSLVLIPAGPFTMGDTFGEGNGDELPLHSPALSAFYMDQFEVTQALWDDVRAWANGHGYDLGTVGAGKAANHPVHNVSWYDAVKWCNARSERERRVPAYYTSAAQDAVYRTGEVDVQNDWVKWHAGYRLPTEAEWEKAARDGAAERRFPWSDSNDIQHSRANYQSYSGETYETSPTRGCHPTFNDGVDPYTSPVGYFAPNGYGLYDMAGNVREWCWDCYDSAYYSAWPEPDPRGPASGSYRVFRGGRWYSYAYFCRSASRDRIDPSFWDDSFGFRVVLAPGQP